MEILCLNLLHAVAVKNLLVRTIRQLQNQRPGGIDIQRKTRGCFQRGNHRNAPSQRAVQLFPFLNGFLQIVIRRVEIGLKFIQKHVPESLSVKPVFPEAV